MAFYDEDVVGKAYDMSQWFHRRQKYGVHEYMYHLYAVANQVERLLSQSPADITDELVVAYLHDVLEDTSATIEDLENEGFSRSVINAVVSITKVAGESYESYITKVKSNPVALLVKKADTLCNLRESVFDGSVGRVKKYTKQLNLLMGGTQ